MSSALGWAMLLDMKWWMKGRGIQGIAFAAIAAAMIVLFGWLLVEGPWLFDGGRLREKDLQPADGIVIASIRTTFVAVGAGAIAVLGLIYTHKSHQHTREKDREQAELTREGQVTDRYVEAIKLLSSDNLTQRLGGIYALARIMRDSEKDHETVVQVLAAFIRQHAPAPSPDAEPSVGDTEIHPEDHVQAALTVLTRRPTREEAFRIHLPNTDLRGANLVRAHLEGADLSGAHLESAYLEEANLEGAYLEGAHLEGANLRGAHLKGALLEKTQLYRALLSGADLEWAILHKANLQRANLHKARMEGAILDGADLRHAQGCRVDSLLTTQLYPSTQLPSHIANDPRIQAHITEALDVDPGAAPLS